MLHSLMVVWLLDEACVWLTGGAVLWWICPLVLLQRQSTKEIHEV